MKGQSKYSILTKAMATIAFFILLTLLVWGVPDASKPSARAGGYFLSTTPSGISLYQPGKYAYYEFSPWNDYVLDAQENRIAFLPADKANRFHPVLPSGSWVKLIENLTSALGYYQPVVTFDGDYRMTYYGRVTGSGIDITRTVSAVPIDTVTATAHTMTFSRDDIVFDTKSILYTENTDSDIEFLKEYYNIPLARHDTKVRRAQANGTVYVINPRITGVLAVVPVYREAIWIDKDWKFVEVVRVRDTGQSLTSTLHLTVLKSPGDVHLELSL